MLNVLDGAVLVVSAVEGVQAQTRVLMRTLQRLGIPTLIFVNKIDRGGAQYESLLRSISERLTPQSIPMGSVSKLGARDAGFTSYGAADAEFVSRADRSLAGNDDAVLAAYVDDETKISYGRLRDELAAQTGRALVHPVFFGSAATGAGLDSLTAGVAQLLPAAESDVDGPASGTVFKVERGQAGEKIAYVRMFSGTVRARDRLRFRRDNEEKVTAIRVFENGSDVQSKSIAAGRIGKLWGLGEVRIGDPIGAQATAREHHYFSPPTLETVVVPRRHADKGALHAALVQLADQDPLINLRQDDSRQEFPSRLRRGAKESGRRYGRVRRRRAFRGTTTNCIERPVGTRRLRDHRQGADPVSRDRRAAIEPAEGGQVVAFRLEVELGSILLSFTEPVEETVQETLRQGPTLAGHRLHGTHMTQSGYWARQSSAPVPYDRVLHTAGDFRNLPPLVLMTPSSSWHRGVRADASLSPGGSRRTLGRRYPVLARLRAVPKTQLSEARRTSWRARSLRTSPRTAATTAVTDPRRRRARVRFRSRPLPTGRRRDPDPDTDRPQPTRP